MSQPTETPQQPAEVQKKGMNWMLVGGVIIVVIIVIAVGYYAVYGMGGGSNITTVTVNIALGTGNSEALNYAPSTITVVIGVNNTVAFMNHDNTTHTVTSTGNFDSNDILAGASWTNTFTTAGTFSFHCKYHSWMSGTIVVKSA